MTYQHVTPPKPTYGDVILAVVKAGIHPQFISTNMTAKQVNTMQVYRINDRSAISISQTVGYEHTQRSGETLLVQVEGTTDDVTPEQNEEIKKLIARLEGKVLP